MGQAVLFLCALSATVHADVGTVCHPEIDPDGVHHVIGYGSLMDTASKQRTWPSADASRPVQVTGFERAWNTNGPTIGFSTTFLGVTPRDDANLVAALFRVFDPADFAAGDTREFPYCRAQVRPDQVTMLDGSAPPDDGQVWIYVVRPEHIGTPNDDFPIIQSYVDLVLNGCIELEQSVLTPDFDFVTACVDTTEGWSTHWVNDRVHPRRPFEIPNALAIDALLHRMLPEEFAAIRLE